MINRFSVLFPIFFAAILAFISYWVQVSVENESEKRGNKLSNSPDYFLTNFKTIQTESNGSIHFTEKIAGYGAVREACDFIMKAQGTYDEIVAPYFK